MAHRIVRKIKLSPSSRFDRKLAPIDFGPGRRDSDFYTSTSQVNLATAGSSASLAGSFGNINHNNTNNNNINNDHYTTNWSGSGNGDGLGYGDGQVYSLQRSLSTSSTGQSPMSLGENHQPRLESNYRY